MARARAQRSGPGRKVVNYGWSSLSVDYTVVPSGSKVLLSFFFLDTAFEETIVRTRGIMSVASDQTAAVEDQRGALGFIRVTDRARVAGAASIPGPITDGDDDGWMVWVPFAQKSVVNVTAPPSMQYMIDSKAQRIVREGQEIAVMVENGDGVTGLTVALQLRVLSRFRS